VVITHLINSLELDIPVFVLDTGMLHARDAGAAGTHPGQLARTGERLPAGARVGVHFVGREGKEAMYKSIELRKACCHIRKVEPLERALAGHAPGSPACAASSRTRAPRCR
jgi:phosphoadenosine phosphosulfate reductase